MPQVGIAVFAPDLNAPHEEVTVFSLHNISRFKRSGETGPSGPGIIFVRGAEQRFPGDDIHINSLLFVVPIFIPEWRLGAFFLSHLELDGG
jgi:hypothetical protein